jgi:hypothetical protein
MDDLHHTMLKTLKRQRKEQEYANSWSNLMMQKYTCYIVIVLFFAVIVGEISNRILINELQTTIRNLKDEKRQLQEELLKQPKTPISHDKPSDADPARSVFFHKAHTTTMPLYPLISRRPTFPHHSAPKRFVRFDLV